MLQKDCKSSSSQSQVRAGRVHLHKLITSTAPCQLGTTAWQTQLHSKTFAITSLLKNLSSLIKTSTWKILPKRSWPSRQSFLDLEAFEQCKQQVFHSLSFILTSLYISFCLKLDYNFLWSLLMAITVGDWWRKFTGVEANTSKNRANILVYRIRSHGIILWENIDTVFTSKNSVTLKSVHLWESLPKDATEIPSLHIWKSTLLDAVNTVLEGHWQAHYSISLLISSIRLVVLLEKIPWIRTKSTIPHKDALRIFWIETAM